MQILMFHFSAKMLISLGGGSRYNHRKMEHQNLHQNKIRERQKIQNHQILLFLVDFEFRFPDICIQCVRKQQNNAKLIYKT